MSRILIVDDDDATRQLCRNYLEDSYEVVDTGDPELALMLALKNKPE